MRNEKIIHDTAAKNMVLLHILYGGRQSDDNPFIVRRKSVIICIETVFAEVYSKSAYFLSQYALKCGKLLLGLLPQNVLEKCRDLLMS